MVNAKLLIHSFTTLFYSSEAGMRSAVARQLTRPFPSANRNAMSDTEGSRVSNLTHKLDKQAGKPSLFLFCCNMIQLVHTPTFTLCGYVACFGFLLDVKVRSAEISFASLFHSSTRRHQAQAHTSPKIGQSRKKILWQW